MGVGFYTVSLPLLRAPAVKRFRDLIRILLRRLGREVLKSGRPETVNFGAGRFMVRQNFVVGASCSRLRLPVPTFKVRFSTNRMTGIRP